ncbi:hypothetical protein ACJ41O_015201 [Fusarium nematophilum]
MTSNIIWESVVLLVLAGHTQAAPVVTSHGPYTGPPPTTTGALSTSVLAQSVAARPPPPGSFDYPADGKLHGDQPAPYTPSGGVGTSGSAPVYRVQSDFDYQSLALAEFDAYGIGAEDRYLIEYMAEQEVGHATVITNMLGAKAPRQCTYDYPMSNAGVYGFLPHLNSGPAAQLFLQSITVEARQQLVFRQFGGQFAMPEWHTPGIPQSWAWTLLAPYISSCPSNQTRLNETTGGYANTLSITRVPEDELCVNASDDTLDCPAAINGTMFLALTDEELYVTPYNLTQINPRVAALAVYQAG